MRVFLEPTQTGFSAYSPDLPGCIATGSTIEETEANFCEAVALHLEGETALAEESPVPEWHIAEIKRRLSDPADEDSITWEELKARLGDRLESARKQVRSGRDHSDDIDQQPAY